MFSIGNYVVCPGHGVGQVSDVEERDFNSEIKKFYIIKIISNGMTVMVPCDNNIEGVRDLVDGDEINNMYDLLHDHEVKVDTSTWNRRYREYMIKIKTGSIIEIADVLRSLFLLKEQKKLSFGEKKMLEHCKDLLIQEISISKGQERDSINTNIESCFQ